MKRKLLSILSCLCIVLSLCVVSTPVAEARAEEPSVLQGLNWCAIGDSYTWGDPGNETFTNSKGEEQSLTATTWLANEVGANLTQVGLGGAHLQAKVVDGEIDTSVANYVTNPDWWYGMKNIPADADIVTIQLGLNDNGYENYPIGSYGDNTVLSAYGAFKVLMDKINETCPNAKVGFIVSDAWLSKDYATFLFDVAEKYDLPVLDISTQSEGVIYGTQENCYNYSLVSNDERVANNLAYRVSDTNGHPNMESHKLRAKSLKAFLENSVLGISSDDSTDSFIRVINGQMCNSDTQQPFQMIGINMDNNCWDATITPGNRCMDETSYAEIKAMGFNTIRFCLAYSMTESDDFYEWLDENVAWAEDAGLKLILDMHAPKGGPQLRNKTAAAEFWSSETVQQDYTRLWVEIAERYKNNPSILMYDLLNEPVVIANTTEEAEEKYVTYMNTLIAAIRAVDTNHIVCVEGYSAQKQGSNVDEFSYVQTTLEDWQNDIVDENVVFDSHTYSPTIFTMQEDEGPVTYDEILIVKDEVIGNGTETFRGQLNTALTWELFETDLLNFTDNTINAGTVRFSLCHLPENAVVYIDNVIIEEYDEQSNYIGRAYECYFDQSGYHWSTGSNYTPEIVSSGYDEVGGSVCLSSTQDNTEYVVKQTANSINGFFKVNPSHQYKVSFYVNSSVTLPLNDIRVDIGGYVTTFTGRLNDFALYQAETYANRAANTGRVQICNEFGINYPGMCNGGDRYLSEMVSAFIDSNIGFCLFAYTGFDFGLMYNSNRDFGTDQCLLRQDNYDATYKAINAGTTYAHVFKNNATMCAYDDLSVGEKVLVLGEEFAGVGSKYEYRVVATDDEGYVPLGNGLFAMRLVNNSEASMQIDITMFVTQVNVTVPLNVNCIINPNVEDGFTYGDVIIQNNSAAPVKVSLGDFTQTSGGFTMLTPDAIGTVETGGLTWDSLNSEQSAKYLSIGASTGDAGWNNYLATGYGYADNISEKFPLGVIAAKKSAPLALAAHYGRSFKSEDEVQLRMFFITELCSDAITPNPGYEDVDVPQTGTWQLKNTTDKKYIILGTDDDNMGDAKFFRLLRTYGFPYTMNVEAENVSPAKELGSDVDDTIFTADDAPALFPDGVDLVTLGKYMHDNNLGEVAQHGSSAKVL